MPFVRFHLVAGVYPDEAIASLLQEASHFYAGLLYPDMAQPPVERVRAFVVETQPQHWATGGKLVSEGGASAPYFVCLALPGRPREQLDKMMAGFTEMICRHLGADISLVRGSLETVSPDDWWIAGQSARQVRAAEVAAREGQGA